MKGISELLIEEGSAPDPRTTLDQAKVTHEDGMDTISRKLIQKYVALAKRTIHPELSVDAREALVKFYVETRRKDGEQSDSVAITARALEALARLSEASARVRLSQEATIVDAERAIRLTEHWRYELMGDNYDETTINSGKKGTVRNRERTILDIVNRLHLETKEIVSLTDVLNEAERMDIKREIVEDIIEQMTRDGRLMSPRGYGTLQPV
jgi:replicative DNA helicase Mcm